MIKIKHLEISEVEDKFKLSLEVQGDAISGEQEKELNKFIKLQTLLFVQCIGYKEVYLGDKTIGADVPGSLKIFQTFRGLEG